MTIRENKGLHPFTTWKVGGPAEFFLEPASVDELREALEWAGREGHPVHVIGRGSNILIPDAGLPGLTICLRNTFQELEYDESANLIRAGAGVSLPRLSRFAADLGWTGYEFLVGIPGTVGGACVMNAGYKKGEKEHIANFCEEVTVIFQEQNNNNSPQTPSSQLPAPNYRVAKFPYKNLNPTYRHTDLLVHPPSPCRRQISPSTRALPLPLADLPLPKADLLPLSRGSSSGAKADPIVLQATFHCLAKADRAQIRAETAKHLAMRKEKQPLTRPTAGSVFKALPDGTPAGKLIDEAGLKGYQIGGARISPKHANWIENTGNATAADIKALIQYIQQTLYQTHHQYLEPEVRIF